MSRGADTKANTIMEGLCSALKRGDRRALEPLAQLCDALCVVGAIAIFVEAAELVIRQAASKKDTEC